MDIRRTCLVCILSVLGCTLMMLQHTHGYCEQGWVQFEDNCYFNFVYYESWPEAKKNCRQRNMDLVSIHNERENSFIYNMIRYSGHDIWIGLHRQPGGTLHGFSWLDGSISNFSNWRNDEPNNRMGNEDCAEMYNENGEWNDLSCNYNIATERQQTLRFICKRKARAYD